MDSLPAAAGCCLFREPMKIEREGVHGELLIWDDLVKSACFVLISSSFQP